MTHRILFLFIYLSQSYNSLIGSTDKFNYCMMKKCALSILLVISINSCTGILGDNSNSIRFDYSNFSNFTFEQTPALGFCPHFESVYKSEIHKNEDGTFIFYASEFQLINRDSKNEKCIRFISSDTLCIVEKPLPERRLNAVEIELVKRNFSSIEIIQDMPGECENISFDPCLIIRCHWDAKKHTDYYCSSNRLPSEQVLLIRNLLDDLRAKK